MNNNAEGEWVARIVRQASLTGTAVEQLRQAVGWYPASGLYERALAGAYTHFSVSDGQRLLGFVNVISDGQFYALLVDLLVHPDVQHRGLGRALVAYAVRSLETDGIWAVQTVFDPALEPFYRAWGFALCQAGLVRTAAAGRGPARVGQRTQSPRITGIAYVGLSVRDALASAGWYIRLLGMEKVRQYAQPDGHVGEVLLRDPRSGLQLGLLAHRSSAGEPFDERRTGLDHLELGVASRAELTAWVARLDALGIPHSGIKERPSAALVTFRDPDNIQLEFYWARGL